MMILDVSVFFNNIKDIFSSKNQIVAYLPVILLTACNLNLKQIVKSGHIPNEISIFTLQKNMQIYQEWVKVHTAEYLLWSGYPEGVKEFFLEEERLYGNISPYRVGIWRVLAQVESEQLNKEHWIRKIKEAYYDENSSDRIHAIETLAKLKIPVFYEIVKIEDILKDTIDNSSIYKLWNFAYTSDENFFKAQNYLLELSISTTLNSKIRTIAAYALKKMGELNSAAWIYLAESALREQTDTLLQANLYSAAIITAKREITKTEKYEQLIKALIQSDEKEYSNDIRMVLLETMAEKGVSDNIGRICEIFNETISSKDPESGDLMSACAYAILMIKNRDN